MSAGTENACRFGQSNLIDKARQQPDKLQQVFQKSRRMVFFRLLTPYVTGSTSFASWLLQCRRSCRCSSGVTGFNVGDRVRQMATMLNCCVPQNLCAVIPDRQRRVGQFHGTGLYRSQGIRLANPTIGETFVVSGLALSVSYCSTSRFPWLSCFRP